MALVAPTGIARRRANVRRGVIAGLVVVCLVIFTGYFRESTGGPLHGAQSTTAGIVAPVQDVATRAVKPFRDAWGWATSLKDARDRAAGLQAENDALRGQQADNAVRDQRLAELDALFGVETLVARGTGIGGYKLVTGLVTQRSITDWFRNVRISVGSSEGIVRNSPVVAGTGTGAALVGVVTAVTSHTADVAFITDGRTEVGATLPEAGNPPGLVQSTTPGELQLTGVPREAPVKVGQVVVTASFMVKGLPSIYPPGIPIGRVSSKGSQEVDVQQTVQVTPYLDPRNLSYLTVMAPASSQARLRASGG